MRIACLRWPCTLAYLATSPIAVAAASACDTAVTDPAVLEQGQAVIREIELDRQPIFDLSVPEENTRLFRLANRYHVMTRASTIRSQLLFKTGEIYSHRVIKESERLLRGNRYLYDARITAHNLVDGGVDLCVSTRDVWTLKPDFSFERAGGENEYSVELEDLNLFGTGAALSVLYGRDAERETTRLRFADPQLGRSRVALALEIAETSDGHRRLIGIQRPFFALDTRWSASFGVLDDQRVSPLYDLGEKVVEYRHRNRRMHLAGGISAGLAAGWVRRWRAGVVVDDQAFDRAPALAFTGPVPLTRKLVYPFVGFEVIEDRYVETSNHDQIGRPEDIYVGTRFAASVGYSATGLGADREAVIFAGDWSAAAGKPERDLMLFDARLDGRFENGRVRNAVAGGRVRFYRRQSDKRLLFATAAVETGQRLELDRSIRLGGDSGLRGYPLAYQNGESRALMTVEQRYFTDWYPLRLLRVGGAVFADIGRTWGRNPVGTGSAGWLRDVGIGLRLTSPRSSSGTVLHIDLAFPLDGDDRIDSVQLLVEGRRGF